MEGPFAVYQRALFAPLPLLVWRPTDVSWLSAPVLQAQVGVQHRRALDDINRLRPTARFLTQPSALAQCLLYFEVEQRLFLPLTSSPLARAIDADFRRAAFEWRDEQERKIACANCNEELLVSAYNAAAAMTQMAALMATRVEMPTDTLKCCISLYNHAELLLCFVRHQMRQSVIGPSLRECEALSAERLSLALNLVHAQLSEYWTLAYGTVQNRPDMAELTAIRAATLHAQVYDALGKDEETLSVVPGFARRLSAVNRYYYRVAALTFASTPPTTAADARALAFHSIEEARKSVGKVKNNGPLEYTAKNILGDLDRFQAQFGEPAKDSYAAAQLWFQLSQQKGNVCCPGSAIDVPELQATEWSTLRAHHVNQGTGALFHLGGPYGYCESGGQKWSSSADLLQQWEARAAQLVEPFFSTPPPPSLESIGSGGEERLALKRLERLGKVMAAMNKYFEHCDQRAPPLSTLWRQIMGYITVITTVAFSSSVKLTAKEVLALASNLANQPSLPQEDPKLLAQLATNEEIRDALPLVEEYETMVHKELTLLRDNVHLLKKKN